MLVIVLAATVWRGTPADKRMVKYVCLKLCQVMFFPEWITTFLLRGMRGKEDLGLYVNSEENLI
tara:strand:+ start:313 stop:504 length:192 start_codon:yes stop_codon:yes gene_type:complete